MSDKTEKSKLLVQHSSRKKLTSIGEKSGIQIDTDANEKKTMWSESKEKSSSSVSSKPTMPFVKTVEGERRDYDETESEYIQEYVFNSSFDEILDMEAYEVLEREILKAYENSRSNILLGNSDARLLESGDELEGINGVEQPVELDFIVSDPKISVMSNTNNSDKNENRCKSEDNPTETLKPTTEREENRNCCDSEDNAGEMRIPRTKIDREVTEIEKRLKKKEDVRYLLQLHLLKTAIVKGNKILDKVEESIGWWKGVGLALFLTILVIPAIVFLAWTILKWHCDVEPPEPSWIESLVNWILNFNNPNYEAQKPSKSWSSQLFGLS